jgi:putative ABC transport system permease protein
MNWWSRFRGDRDVRDLDDEVRFHIEMQTQRNIERGMDAREARRQARRSFGSIDGVKEEVLDQYPVRILADFGQDVRFGVRSLLSAPAATATAVLALMLGIGLSTLVFSIVYGVMLRGLPFAESDRLMSVSRSHPEMHPEESRSTVHDFSDWQARQRSFDALGAFRIGTVNLRHSEGPERFEAAYVTHELFDQLRVSPVVGRSITAADDRPGAPWVVLIDYGVWQTRFAGNPAVLGQAVRVNGEAATIIGVMPEGFGFPMKQQVWLPLRLDALREPRSADVDLEVIGRLADGVNVETAQRDMSRIAQALEVEHPVTNKDAGALVTSLMSRLMPVRFVAVLWAMLGAVGIVLLIACSNVANIIMSRNAVRAREIGLRCALGASRLRVLRQFLTEALLLSGAGALLGLGLAWVGVRLFNAAVAGTNPPFWIDIAVHSGVLVFAFALTFLSALLAGVIPALQAARSDANTLLKENARGGHSFRVGRLSRSLVAVEIALSVGLLVGAGLMIRSVINLRTADLGFATHNVFTGAVTLPQRDYATAPARQQFFAELVTRLQEVPGVKRVALSTALPGLGAGGSDYIIEGRTYATEQDRPSARLTLVTPDFFAALESPVLHGRVFTAADGAAREPVAVISESLARREFAGADPVGQRIRMADETDGRRIVGVVPDLYMAGIARPGVPAIFLPLAQSDARTVIVAALASGAPLALTRQIRAAVTAVDPELPVYFVSSLQGAINKVNWFIVVFGGLFTVFGGAALLLSAVGLYGVMATAVRQRTREIGVRMALGARATQVLQLILREGMVQLLIGMTAGLAFALFLSRLLPGILFLVPSNDKLTFVLIIIVLTATAAVATLVPALRASRVQPIDALRHE